MKTYYVISDMVLFNDEQHGIDYYTGFLAGSSALHPKIERARLFNSLQDCKDVLSSGEFADPTVHEVCIRGGKRVIGKFHDMVQEYGYLGVL